MELKLILLPQLHLKLEFQFNLDATNKTYTYTYNRIADRIIIALTFSIELILLSQSLLKIILELKLELPSTRTLQFQQILLYNSSILTTSQR